MRPFYILLFLAISLASAACRATPTPSHPAVTIHFDAADSTQLLARDLADAYHRTHSYATFQLSVSNSSSVLHEFALGSPDLALISRSPRADELTGRSARTIELARDGIISVVNPSNSLAGITRDQAAKIFAGEILKWSELAGQASNSDDSIQVVSREEGSGTRAVFEDIIMAGRRVTLTAIIESSEKDVFDYVASHPNAIGYASFNLWQNNTQARALALDQVEPTLANIQASRYPLMRTFYLVVPELGNPDLNDFVSFAKSAVARSIIASRMGLPQ